MNQLSSIRNGLADALRAASARIGTPRFIVRDDLGGMTDSIMLRHFRETGTMLVWSGGSDRTIWGDPSLNYVFRAWHDYAHIRSGVCNRRFGPLGCFEPVAEYVVADWQCRGLPDELARIVQIEVSGQARHYEQTGTFIDDQIRFTVDRLALKL